VQSASFLSAWCQGALSLQQLCAANKLGNSGAEEWPTHTTKARATTVNAVSSDANPIQMAQFAYDWVWCGFHQFA